MSKIIPFYESILTLGNLTVNKDSMVSAEMDGVEVPVTINNKRLVLPTREHLNNPNKSDIVIFHPLSENILRNESDVMARYRMSVNISLNWSIGNLLSNLIILAASPQMHSKLKSDQFDFLALMKDADEKTSTDFNSLMKAMSLGNVDKCFVHIYIKKGAVISGKNYPRGSIVTFPFYEELCKEDRTVFGVKLRKKDFESFKAIFEYLFPNLDKKDYYSRGNISGAFPTLDCLLVALTGITSQINNLIELYENVIDGINKYSYDSEWANYLENIEQFNAEIRMLPMQNGNEGNVAPNTQITPPLQNVTPPTMQHYLPPPIQANQPTQYHNQAPTPAPGPVLTSDGKINLAATLRTHYPQGQYMPPQPQQMDRRNSPPAFMSNNGMFSNNQQQPQQGFFNKPLVRI